MVRKHLAVVECFGEDLQSLRSGLAAGTFASALEQAAQLSRAAASLSTATSEVVVSKGSKIYLNSEGADLKSIGEVLFVDRSQSVGVAVVNLAAVRDSDSGHFVAISTAADAAAEEVDDVDAESDSTPATETEPTAVADIHVITPWWLTGLDEKTGNMLT